MSFNEATSEDEVVVAERKVYGAVSPTGENIPLAPRADIGVLLVHGIGNHREGVTLRAFGQPLLDWLKQWLRGVSGDHARGGDVTVKEARFNDSAAPAYALAEITGAKSEEPGQAPRESWLFCEGWWGATVQSPASLQLLRWMWKRGPLLIYWHFYIRQTASTKKDRLEEGVDLIFIVVAFLLAGFCQLVIGIAIVLSLIPIGPWRRKVVDAVRVLTLTLGDSYVLEEDIQQAALVERVRHALDWLAKRTTKTIVIAHSQGGAISHEVLRQYPPDNLAMFISVGSGLEKLHFLREAAMARKGLVVAPLLFPVVALAGAILLGAGRSAAHWQIGLSVLLFLIAFVLAIDLGIELKSYKKRLRDNPNLKLPTIKPGDWIDIYASDDVVPMNRGSLLEGVDFVTRSEVYNERSYVRDHVSYFTNVNDCLPQLWLLLAQLSGLRLFDPEDVKRLGRFARVHKAASHVISFSRLSLFIALFLGGYVLRDSLLEFGRSVLLTVEGTAIADWLKPVRALSGALTSIIQKLWNPSGVSADIMANALFGAAVLLGVIALWWIIFRGFWLWRCTVRWRKACRGKDVLLTRWARLRFPVIFVVFLGFGCLPLIVSIVLATSPEILTVAALGNAVAVSLAALVWLIVIFYAAGAPWIVEASWQDQRQLQQSGRNLSYFGRLTQWWRRSTVAIFICIFVVGLLYLERWLWPWEVKESTQELKVGAIFLVMAFASQVYAIVKIRNQRAIISSAAIIALPVVPLLLNMWFHFKPAFLSTAFHYLILTVIVVASILWLRLRSCSHASP